MQSKLVNQKVSSFDMGNSTENILLVSELITFDNNIGKFIIPTLTPTLSNEPTDISMPKGSTSNLINKDNLGLSKITTSNYFELEVPKHLFTIKEITINPNIARSGEDNNYITNISPTTTIIYNEFIKGQRFIVTYTKANKEDPVIIGVIPS